MALLVVDWQECCNTTKRLCNDSGIAVVTMARTGCCPLAARPIFRSAANGDAGWS
jgi:hypothetical protein